MATTDGDLPAACGSSTERLGQPRHGRRRTPPAPGPAGEVAVICVDELTVKLAAAKPPKETAVAPVKFVPVITTLVPPVVLPEVVPRLVTVGKEAAV